MGGNMEAEILREPWEDLEVPVDWFEREASLRFALKDQSTGRNFKQGWWLLLLAGLCALSLCR